MNHGTMNVKERLDLILQRSRVVRKFIRTLSKMKLMKAGPGDVKFDEIMQEWNYTSRYFRGDR